MPQLRFSVVFGVVAGYGHDNHAEELPEKIVAHVWQKVAKEILQEQGIYISAVVSPSITIYDTEWGCPEGGEFSATVTGCQNVHFCPDAEKYREAVIAVVSRCQAILEQTTAFIEFAEVETQYLRRQE